MKTFIFFVLSLAIAYSSFSQDATADKMPYQVFDSLSFPDGIESINIYIKEECGRCHDFIKILDEASIEYTPYIMNNDSISAVLDNKIYKTLPVKGMGYSVRFPVLEINGILYFCIASHYDFAHALKDFMEKE